MMQMNYCKADCDNGDNNDITMKLNDDVKYKNINTDDDNEDMNTDDYKDHNHQYSLSVSFLQQGRKRDLDSWCGVCKINNKLIIDRFKIKLYSNSIKVRDESKLKLKVYWNYC